MTAVSQPTMAGAPGGRPPHAVVGSQISRDEEMFGAAYDGRVVRRFFEFVWPYRGRLCIALIAVLVFAVTQLSVPLIIRMVIDDVLQMGEHGAPEVEDDVLAGQPDQPVLGPVGGVVDDDHACEG